MKKITLAQLVRDALSSTETPLSVKDVLSMVVERATTESIEVNADYRNIYQHLRVQGKKVEKGTFTSRDPSDTKPWAKKTVELLEEALSN